jgi:hypothetical protein
MTHYQQAKQRLKQFAKEVKAIYPKDKPAQREAINNMADSIGREFWRYMSDRKASQCINWISSFAASLHP